MARQSRLAAILAFLSLLVVPLVPAVAASRSVTVLAAASLGSALQGVAEAYTARTGGEVKLSFAATSALAKQVEAGAGGQVFISADEAWMDWLEARGRIESRTRRELLGNRLVLVVPADRPLHLDLANPGWLERLPPGRIATGDPAHVPVGKYAMAALTRLGLASEVKARLARADSAPAALVLVERGEAAAGIVYATDAAASKRVAVAGLVPEWAHPPIVYSAALLSGGRDDAARAFLAFLGSEEAREIFVRHGFTYGAS